MHYRLSAQETAALENFAEQCRYRSIPESLAKAIAAYLRNDGSLASIHDEYQSAIQAGVPWLASWLSVSLTVLYRQNAGAATLTPFGEHALDVAILTDSVAAYLSCAAEDGPIEQIVTYLRTHDVDEKLILQWMVQTAPYIRQVEQQEIEDEDADGNADDDNDLDEEADDVTKSFVISNSGRFFLGYLPDRFNELAQAIKRLNLPNQDFWHHFVELLATADKSYLDLAATIAQQLSPEARSFSLPLLLRADPARFSSWMRDAVLDPNTPDYRRYSLLDALTRIVPAQHRDLLERFVRDSATIFPNTSWYVGNTQCLALEALYKLDADATLPLVQECIDGENQALAVLAIRLLTTAGVELDEARAARLQRIVAERPLALAQAAAHELLNRPWAGRKSFAHSLHTHRYAKLRDEAIHWWQEQGEQEAQDGDIFTLLTPLLDHGNADIRLTALLALHRADSQRALPLLVSHYASEKSLKVRQALDLLLPANPESSSDEGAGAPAERIATLSAEVALLASKRWQAPPWLDWERIATLHWITGEAVPRDVLRGLLYRQAQLKNMLLDKEVRRAAALLNRTEATAVAQSLLAAWFADGARARYFWLLPLIGALAGDDLVPVVRERINKLRKGAQSAQIASKLTQMLAQMGTPLALSEVHDLAQRAKQRAVRRNARLAFAEATRDRTMSVDDLEDEIVPRLGFDAAGAQTFVFGSHQLTIKLGYCLDLQLWSARGELLLALPRAKAGDDKAAIVAAKQRWQHLKKQLQQLATIQSARLDQACSRRRSWPLARWCQLFLDHPVLRSLATAYVWEATGSVEGKQAFFRLTNDGTLLDIEDAPVKLPDDGIVHLAHPLAMDSGLRDRWLERLSDDDIAPRIPQLDRPVMALAEARRDDHYWTREQGHVILVSDLLSIAERTGWQPPDPDLYSYDLLYKSFPSAEIEAVLSIGTVWQGANRFATVPLIHLCFVPAGTVAQSMAAAGASSTAPDKAQVEACALPLGKVPALVFSEAASDMTALGAKGAFDPHWQSGESERTVWATASDDDIPF